MVPDFRISVENVYNLKIMKVALHFISLALHPFPFVLIHLQLTHQRVVHKHLESLTPTSRKFLKPLQYQDTRKMYLEFYCCYKLK